MGLLDFLFKSKPFSKTTVSSQTEDLIKRDWEKTDELLKLGNPGNLRQALLVADRTLDSALKELFDGNTMGERLKVAVNTFERSFYQKIWDAHKMRNSLVHEAGFEPPHYVVKEAIEVFREAVRKFGVRI